MSDHSPQPASIPPPANPVAPAARPMTQGHQPGVQAAGQPTAGMNPPADGDPMAPGPRRVRLAISRIDPWSVMKLSFLLSIAAGIILVVAVGLVWVVLNEME
ncbi:MAG TPA: DUF3566 domain-containing protein, partial [Beutenbergiaceae bacterium]|nr:DUF3566 domain-containing protein [Beutenbergiaceae bacterium]